MWWWWSVVARAGGLELLGLEPVEVPKPAAVTPTVIQGPTPANVEVVQQFVEGQVRLVLAGREGDKVYIDGWNAGVLPLETLLTGGPHEFRVEGLQGRLLLTLDVPIVAGKVSEVQLVAPPPPEVPAPASASPAPGGSPAPTASAPVPNPPTASPVPGASTVPPAPKPPSP